MFGVGSYARMRPRADLKLLSASDALTADGFKADTPYTIMFGPDKCGETNKVHFILRHKNPVRRRTRRTQCTPLATHHASVLPRVAMLGATVWRGGALVPP